MLYKTEKIFSVANARVALTKPLVSITQIILSEVENRVFETDTAV
jgi:hypothetical protein